MTHIEIVSNPDAVFERQRRGGVKQSQSKGGLARVLSYLASVVSPNPPAIEVRLENGSMLKHIPARVWQRHSALISARYENKRGKQPCSM
jgi:hypothetical protein